MQKIRLRKILLELVMILFTVIYMFPVLNLVFSSLKSTGDLMRNPVGLPSVLELGNYVVAWTKMDYPRAFFNTVIICGGSIFFHCCYRSHGGISHSQIPHQIQPGNVSFLSGHDHDTRSGHHDTAGTTVL